MTGSDAVPSDPPWLRRRIAENAADEDFARIVKSAKAQALYDNGASVTHQRQAFRDFAGSPPARQPCLSTRIRTGVLAGRRVHQLAPAEQSIPDVLLYLHGGAFTIGCFEGEVGVGESFCRTLGAETFGLDYAQAPEDPFPAAIENVAEALEQLRRERAGQRIFVAGDSAGGALAISASIRLREAGLPQPSGIISVSAPLDLTASAESWVTNESTDLVPRVRALTFFEHYLAGVSPLDPTASPIYADLRGLPPMLLVVGGVETLVDEVTIFAGRANKAGCDVSLHVFEGLPHNFIKFDHPAADEVYALAASWVQQRL